MNFEKEGNTLTVKLDKELVFENSNNTKEKIKAQITNDIDKLILDMIDVTFIDSSGIGMLISLLKLMNIRNGEFALKNISGLVSRLLTITKLNTFFQIIE